MKLEDELRQLFGATHDAPWPGEREAFDRFLRRRARRGRRARPGWRWSPCSAAPCWWPAGSPRAGRRWRRLRRWYGSRRRASS